MNKTFKVVFNAARGKLMVTSEATTSHHKSKVRSCVVATAALGLLMSAAFPASAASNYIAASKTYDQKVVKKSGTYDYATVEKGFKYTLGNSKSEYSFVTHHNPNAIAGIAVRRGVIFRKENGSIMVINGKNLSVDVLPSEHADAKDYAFGAYVATANKKEKERGSQLIINSENTSIVAKADKKLGVDGVTSAHAVGIAAMSWGQVQVNGNVSIDAEDAILSRGYAVVDINSTQKKTVKLTGNIDFNFDKATSGTTVDSTVKINLSDADSFWTGRSLATDDSIGEVVLPSSDPNFGLGKNTEGFVLGISNGAVWNMTGNSFVNALNLQGSATVKGNDAVKTFNATAVTVTGADNKLLFDRGTTVKGKIALKKDASLTTRVDTAFVSTLVGDVVTGVAAKGTNENPFFEFEEGSTLHIDDAVKYTNAALDDISKAYGNQSIVLDNGSLYVAPDATDRNIDIASNLTVNLKALGDQDLAGGADQFTIAGTVNVTASMDGTTPVTGVKLNDVYVSGTTEKAASLNLDNLQTTAKNLTVSNGTVSLKGEKSSLTVGDLTNAGTIDATGGVVNVNGTLTNTGSLAASTLNVMNGTSKDGALKTDVLNVAGTFVLGDKTEIDQVAVKDGATLNATTFGLNKLDVAQKGQMNATGALTADVLANNGSVDADTVIVNKTLTNNGTLKVKTLTIKDGTTKDGTLETEVLNVAGAFELGNNIVRSQANVGTGAKLTAQTLDLTSLSVAKEGLLTTADDLTAAKLDNAGTVTAKTINVKDGSSKNGSLTAEVLNVAGAFELGNNELNQVNVSGGASLAAQTLNLTSLSVAKEGKLTAAEALKAADIDNAGSISVKSLDAAQLKGEGTLTAENIVFGEKNDLSGFKGAATLNGGTYELTDQNAVRWFGGKTTLTGASVDMSKFTNAEGALANMTVAGGKLTAVSGQIFKTKLADTYVGDPEAVVTKAGLKSGTLTFVDDKYSVDYANKADALIKDMTLVFMGSLVSAPAPEVPPAVEPSKKDLKTEDLNKLNPDNKVIFDSALDTADQSHDSLVIGSTEEVNSSNKIENPETIKSNVGVSQIKLPDQTDLVAVNSNRTLTLIGTGADESLIATETGARIEVGGKTTAGVLALGVRSDAVANAGTLNVDTNIGQKGLVEVNAGNFTASKKVTNNGQIVVKEGAALSVDGSLELKAGSTTAVEGMLNTSKDAKVNVETGAKLALNGVAAIEQIDVTKHLTHEEALVTVGDNDKAGKAIINKLGEGAEYLTFFLDPIWQEGAGISDASSLALTDLSSGVTSKFIVGQNSVLSLGATTALAEQAFANIAHVNGKFWGEDITAAAYADKPVDLGSTGSLVINGQLTLSDTVTTPNAKTVDVAANGMLIINQDNVVADTAFFTAGSENATVTLADNSYVAIVNAKKDAAPVKLAETVNDEGAKVVTDNPFFSGAIADNTVTTKFESEAGLAAIASTGIQSMARRADFVMSETVANRTSLDQQINAGVNLWVDVTGERYEADKLDNNGSFRSDAGYATFGGDVQVADGLTAGLALQYGDASLRSDISSIKNSIKSYGLTAYAGQTFGAAKVVGELAWLKSENKITASQTAMNQKLDVNVYSAGVRAQYELTAGGFKFVPSIGLRASLLETDDMTIGTIKATDSDLTYVQMPISLRISGGEVAASGWTFAPSLKVAYVPTFGDKEIKVYGASQDVLDMSPVQADFGVRAVNGNLMFNADMMIGGGEYGTSSIGGKVGVKYVF